MVHMSEWMRAASQDGPPSAISVDGLVAGERRRVRRLRWAVGGAAAVLAVGVGFAVISPDRHPVTIAAVPAPVCPTVDLTATPEPGPQQSHPAPRPSESCGAAARRLTAVLAKALDAPVDTFAWNTKRLRYETLVNLPGGGRMQVRIIAGHEYPARRADTQCPTGADWKCSYLVTGDETVVTTVDSGQGVQADAYRRDGTMILVLATADALPPEQLATIAGNPGLTLFPQ
ncbi:hypothetical protein ACTI_70070 [Actinoplanes sp. OR16]|uniref:hypothetical protein n=1 Tax=Actinoplanes sp. OR16 TaxID=946334 RepID=UPI000F719DFC|nr:hypothetical protein [Actinoplanes sp. OR16]BBH70322.1 hypothetical protein ACTI_70070 [Actinoplanes sp. OR16]